MLESHREIELLEAPPNRGKDFDRDQGGVDFCAWETKRRGYYCVARRGSERETTNSVVAVITTGKGEVRVVADYWTILPRRYGGRTRSEEVRILLIATAVAIVLMLIFSSIFTLLCIPLAYVLYVKGKRFRDGRATPGEVAEKAQLESLLGFRQLSSTDTAPNPNPK
jgi:hypothetical protein